MRISKIKRTYSSLPSRVSSYLSLRWLDTLTLMLDANFRLKSKERGIKSDPALGSGLAYYVEEEKYQEHLKTCSDQTEASFFC